MSSSKKEVPFAHQLNLIELDPPLFSPESFPIGLETSEIFTKIFNTIQVSEFSTAIYNPSSQYHEELLQEIQWHKWSPNLNLSFLSDTVYNSSKEVVESRETGDIKEIILCSMLAITSKVKVDQQVMHIPMLDFSLKKSQKSINAIQKIAPSPGLIIETDNSYHYIGLTLMKNKEWFEWISTISWPLDDETDSILEASIDEGYRDVFMDEYIDICIKRGYTGLRIKGYEDTEKEVTPRIIAHTT